MVNIRINKNRRENLRRLHTATHILNWAAREILGPHVWQNGSNLKEEFGTLDITHYKNLTDEEKIEIERLVNRVIWDNKKVIVEELPRDEAEKRYGFILYQGGAIPMKTLRVVKIQDSDVEACGGTHMISTGGIGFFKLIESSKIQDGVIRLKFMVEKFALNYVNEQEKIIEQIQNIYSVQKENLTKTCLKFFNEWKERGKEIENLNNKLKDLYIENILSSNKNEYEIKDATMPLLVEIFSKIKNNKSSFKLKSDKFIILSQNLKPDFDFKKSIDKKDYTIYIL